MEFTQKEFIYGRKIDLDLCDGLIEYFEEFPMGRHVIPYEGRGDFICLKRPGHTANGDEGDKQEDGKTSTDLGVPYVVKDSRVAKFNQALNEVLDDYCKKFPNCEKCQQPWGNAAFEQFNIQKYKPKEGFTKWHTERASLHPNVISRHLVWMTYLNDVKDGGGTEWYHQDFQVQAQKGLTVIWPAEWTHVHRGIVSPTETKYIATGWFCYLPTEEEWTTPDRLQGRRGYFYSRDLFIPFE